MSDLLTVVDQMKREVTLSYPPRRIVSLVPSQTEFLIDIGAPVVGRTKFCIHPKEKVKNIPIVGGTKKFRFDEIRKLKPDLIIGNKEENYKEGIQELEKEYPVWMSDIFNLEDAFGMMKAIGKITGLEKKATEVKDVCIQALEGVKGTFSGRVVYLIWRDPWMAAGKNTFIDEFLSYLAYENVVKDARYPQLTTEQIATLNPDCILLSSEPYPFKAKHLEEARKLWPEVQVRLVDGELYSWYGSRLKDWASYSG